MIVLTLDDINARFINDRQNLEEKRLTDLREKSKKVILTVLRHVKEPIAAHFDWLNMNLQEVIREVQTLGVIDSKDAENILREVSIDVSSTCQE